jgi:hypothetical protein
MIKEVLEMSSFSDDFKEAFKKYEEKHKEGIYKDSLVLDEIGRVNIFVASTYKRPGDDLFNITSFEDNREKTKCSELEILLEAIEKISIDYGHMGKNFEVEFKVMDFPHINYPLALMHIKVDKADLKPLCSSLRTTVSSMHKYKQRIFEAL